jgi:hypothetical protein
VESFQGLPAIGASVIAANQGTGHTVNSVISIDGKYYLDLAPGKYNIIIAFSDGISQAYNDVVIKRGTASEMDFNISKEEKTSNPTILFLFQYFDQNRSQKLGTP